MTKRRIVSFLLVLAMLLSVTSALTVMSFAASEGITEASGWFESAYVEWTSVSGADGYNVYVKEASATSWKRIDDMLIRKYADYWRADAVGLKAGIYQLKVLPVSGTTELTDKALVTDNLTVLAYDRSGYAHQNSSASGAYNDDGTLKSDAQVIYVTAKTAKTCTAIVNGTLQTGLQTILDAKQKKTATETLCIRIVGLVTKNDLDHISSSAEGLQIKGSNAYSPMNITIEGIGEDATISGFGVLIRNCKNVEIRNLGIMNFMDDGISVDTDNSNLWIHNCDFFYGHAGSDDDQAKGDGSLDTKKSQYVTYSYNHFYDSGKVHLVGNGDDSVNYLTFHHNWYDHADSRMPRVRCGTVHVYNNFYDGVSKYGIGSTMDSDIFSENNYFLNANYPMLISKQGSDIATDSKGTFSGEDGGIIKAYGNVIIGAKRFVSYQENATQFDAYVAESRNEQVPSSVKALQGGATYNNFDTASDFYSYTPESADDAMNTVKKYAGRINGGDFKWTFTSADNTSYDLNQGLKNALTSYVTSLVSVGGNPNDSYVDDNTPGGDTPGGNTPGGDQPGSDTEDPGEDKMDVIIPEGAYIHNFTESEKTSDFFSITGNIAKDKGAVFFNGLTLNKCLKMESESKTRITFTATEGGELILLYGGLVAPAGETVKIDGVAQTVGDDNMLKIKLEAGDHTIQKGNTQIYLYYMVFVPASLGEAHVHNYEYAITVHPTCTTNGVLTYSCSCEDNYTQEMMALGHYYIHQGTTPAGCETEGVKTEKCDRCGDIRTETLDAIGHSYSSEITTAPGCTVSGVKTFTCGNCGDGYTEILSALGHSYADGSCSRCGAAETLEHEHSYTGTVIKEATCAEFGIIKYECSCGDNYVNQITAKGHKYNLYYFTDPTCTEQGEEVYKCSCGSTYSKKIDAIGHDYKEELKDATCTQPGTKTYTCSNCEESYTEKIAAKGHNFEDGVCSKCGVEEEEDVQTPDQPDNDEQDENQEKPAEKLGFFQRIFRAIANFFRRLFGKPTK